MQIFVSYRRSDSDDVTGRIYDRLIVEFGRDAIFKDVDSIPPGANFRKHLYDAVQKCDVLLAVIGRQWLDARNESGGLRLADTTDFVRIEIEAALQRDIPVVPVLVQGAQIPGAADVPASIGELCDRQAVHIRSDPDFHRDVDRLLQGLHGHDYDASSVARSGKSKMSDSPEAAAVADSGIGNAGRKPEIAELLAALLQGGTAAKPPVDIDRAIAAGLADVDTAIHQLVTERRKPALKDINELTSRAIQHGAGIYNHSEFGRIGCGRIYHRTAVGLLGRFPPEPSGSDGRPQFGADLACDWLNRIVEGTPVVSDHNADNVAWQLRFAFDSIPLISHLDELHDLLARLGADDQTGRQIGILLAEALRLSRKRSQVHVQVFELRHIAEVLVWLIHSDYSTIPKLETSAQHLTQALSECKQIGRRNRDVLQQKLGERVGACRDAFLAPSSPGDGDGKNRKSIWRWFGRR